MRAKLGREHWFDSTQRPIQARATSGGGAHARKKDAALRAARGEQVVRRMPVSRKHARTEDAVVVRADLPSPAWKEKARERVAAELQRRAACEARLKEAQDRWYYKEQERMAKRYGRGSVYAKLLQASNGPAPDSKWYYDV